jgi:hypothetical protein
MATASKTRIVTRSTQSVATEDTEGKAISVSSVMRNSVPSVLLLLLALSACQPTASAPAPVEISMHIYPAPFETPGYSLILVLYKNFIANYYVLVYDPNGDDGSGGGSGGGSTPGTGIDVPINW